MELAQAVQDKNDPSLEDRIAARDATLMAVFTDLIGPSAPDEELKEPPLGRYVTGILYPSARRKPLPVSPEENFGESDDDEGAADPAVAMGNVKYPSSAGITFAVDAGTERLVAVVSAGLYKNDGGVWKREPIGPVELDVPVKESPKLPFNVAEGLNLYVKVRRPANGVKSITVVLINKRVHEGKLKDQHSFFQVGLEIRGTDGDSPFVARRGSIDLDDDDVATNDLLFRNRREFAVGHGCSAFWDDPDSRGRSAAVRITFQPNHQVRITRPNPEIPDEALRFDRLISAPDHEVIDGLHGLASLYGRWIADQRLKVPSLPDELAKTADRHLDHCQEAQDRIVRGIDVLADDTAVMRAFRLMNKAMLEQMIRKTDTEDGKPPRWRPFQLAFILLALPSVVDPDHQDRKIADLLWFPTGGGKTEAYLGLFALAMFYRRLTTGAAGVTALMRYTLRLLTTQQFERACRVVCACEVIRRREQGLGDEPISIGLFVGMGATPNKRADAESALKKLRAGNEVHQGNPMQLTACPWCNSALGTSNYSIRTDPDRLHIECRNSECEFSDSDGLPVYVVDEDIYRVRPTLVIGTVDKFASFPWRPKVGHLFNRGFDEPPPDLIIQDELHLISGPLGTMTALYESIIDLLCAKGGRQPKIVASTATIRRAKSQTSALFDREMRQFPPPGLDPGDSWFATEAAEDEVGTRKYVGLMAPGVSHATLLIRTYAALLHHAQTYTGTAHDPYRTLVGYFNSLRVLGAARMQVQDDVQERLKYLAGNAGDPPAQRLIELTSRTPSGDIPDYLDRLGLSATHKDGVDVALATNMISVGVDVDRLGLMVIMGQPQAAAEYIQASSRVGRKYPGLVFVLFNAARSRDLSHYEGFKSFHQTLYRSVEATSVTPFSPRARDRGLHAVLIGLARQQVPALRDDASAAPQCVDQLNEVRDSILDRVQSISPDDLEGAREQLDEIIDEWVRRAQHDPDLVYESRNERSSPLMTAAAPEAEAEKGFATMWSLRDVDAESNLYWEDPN